MTTRIIGWRSVARLKAGRSGAQTEEAIRPVYRAILEDELALRNGLNAEARAALPG